MKGAGLGRAPLVLVGLAACVADGAANRAPEGTLVAPAGDVEIARGERVTFEGACVDPDGDPVTHAWDFSGGGPARSGASTGPVSFDTPGAFLVTYTCRDDADLADPEPPTLYVTVKVPNTAPVATIEAPSGPTSVVVGQAVTFAGRCVDPDGDEVTHAWDFDGGARDSDLEDPGEVAFAAAGSYVVTYTCTDARRLASDPSPTVTISVTPAPR